MMGWRSRSTLYRLRKLGALDSYITPGPGSAEVLMLAPDGHPPLREYLAGAVRLQHGSPLERLQRPRPVDPLEALQCELAHARAEVAASQARELEWMTAYQHFRDWASSASEAARVKRGGWPGKDLGMTLWAELGENPLIGDVMVAAHRLITEHLRELNRCELDTRRSAV